MLEIYHSDPEPSIYIPTAQRKVLFEKRLWLDCQDPNRTQLANHTGAKCSNFKAETSALQICSSIQRSNHRRLSSSQTQKEHPSPSLISSTSDQSIHQLPKDLQLFPQECIVVQQWIPASVRLQAMNKQIAWPSLGANNCNSCSSPLTTSLLRNSQIFQRRRATGDYKPSTDPVKCLARHEQITIFRLRTKHD